MDSIIVVREALEKMMIKEYAVTMTELDFNTRRYTYLYRSKRRQ